MLPASTIKAAKCTLPGASRPLAADRNHTLDVILVNPCMVLIHTSFLHRYAKTDYRRLECNLQSCIASSTMRANMVRSCFHVKDLKIAIYTTAWRLLPMSAVFLTMLNLMRCSTRHACMHMAWRSVYLWRPVWEQGSS